MTERNSLPQEKRANRIIRKRGFVSGSGGGGSGGGAFLVKSNKDARQAHLASHLGDIYMLPERE